MLKLLINFLIIVIAACHASALKHLQTFLLTSSNPPSCHSKFTPFILPQNDFAVVVLRFLLILLLPFDSGTTSHGVSVAVEGKLPMSPPPP